MTDSENAQLRKYPRFETNLVCVIEKDGKRYKATIKNISQEGCMLESTTVARVGETWSITFSSMGKVETFTSKVIWSKPFESLYRFGICYWAMQENVKKEIFGRMKRTSNGIPV